MTTDLLVGLRPRLFSLAYRLLGDAQAADDVVQDARSGGSSEPPRSTTHAAGSSGSR
ncbi:MAG TPA: sigma factor [Labilithrix sp.]|nr:sigma factor [Labilithrix sp.]